MKRMLLAGVAILAIGTSYFLLQGVGVQVGPVGAGIPSAPGRTHPHQRICCAREVRRAR